MHYNREQIEKSREQLKQLLIAATEVYKQAIVFESLLEKITKQYEEQREELNEQNEENKNT